MATTLNAGTTSATALNVITDTTGAMAIQTSGTTAIAISNAQVVSLTNPLAAASGGTGLSSLGTGIATFLGTPSSANLAAAVTDETGTGALVFANSPTLTGIPLSTTAAYGTNTTQIATTAFVQAAVPAGVIVMWSGSIATIPSGWALCNGSSGTPDLRDRFVVGAGSTYAVAATGGSANATLVSHTHTATVTDPGHAHTINTNLSKTDMVGGGSNLIYTRQPGTDATASAVTGITVGNSTEGSSATNANLPPYYALAYIMKT
jgi:hypothetical protein